MNKYAIDGPKQPKLPIALIHPLGPLFKHLPLSLRRHLLHFRAFGKWGNFRNPTTWSEKTQWRILNDRRVFLGVCCDKLAAKEFGRRVAVESGLPLRIPETYWAGTDVRELMRIKDQLPARWVLKPNHSSSRFRILDESTETIDWDDLIAAGDRWVKKDEEELAYGHYGYGLARHLVFAEERVGSGASLATFRANVVNGKILNCSYTFGTIHPDNPVPRISFRYDGALNRQYTDVLGVPAKPEERSRIDELPASQKSQLIDIVLALAAGIEQTRVDLYVEDEIWFGELTVYNGSGLMIMPRPYTEPIEREWILPNLSRPDERESEWRELLSSTPLGTLQRLQR